MKSFLNRAGLLIICLFEIIIGVIILFNPVSFAAALLKVAGIGLLIYGAMSILLYFRTEPVAAAAELKLFKGITSIAVGLMFVFKTMTVYGIISELSIVFALMLLLLGIYKLQTAADMFRLRLRFWYVALISAALSLVFAAVIFLDPFGVHETMWLFIGVCVIVEGISDLITFLVGKITDTIEDGVHRDVVSEQ